ncbi:hypothetical protein IEQ34_002721 [Dendrobium chrysotoxum]|uniref:Uncharacterized protein n=1 Tax=Dendrobium chrysotoxum TaxID=161865 RepID=A0AAV7HJS0_DENCH|nr:hypothetical protein IEQ34_002721 [Dendrobium chrysotoxum]
MTRAPRMARWTLISEPMPPEPPVTMATRSFSGNGLVYVSGPLAAWARPLLVWTGLLLVWTVPLHIASCLWAFSAKVALVVTKMSLVEAVVVVVVVEWDMAAICSLMESNGISLSPSPFLF